MATLITDPDLERRLRRRRRRTGADRWDEAWDGVYVMSPSPNNEHIRIGAAIVVALWEPIVTDGLGLVLPGPNVSDRPTRWRQNYRCPDVAVFLADNPAEDCGSHWFGGPDLAVEIVSPGDRSREKLPFYAAVGTKELLILDRDPWRLELFRLENGELRSAGPALPDGEPLVTHTVGFRWRLVSGPDRPRLVLVAADGRRWEV